MLPVGGRKRKPSRVESSIPGSPAGTGTRIKGAGVLSFISLAALEGKTARRRLSQTLSRRGCRGGDIGDLGQPRHPIWRQASVLWVH